MGTPNKQYANVITIVIMFNTSIALFTFTYVQAWLQIMTKQEENGIKPVKPVITVKN